MGLDGQPWCMSFVQWVFAQAGASHLLPAKTGSCGALMQAAKAAGLWVESGYRPGDVVIYDFPGGAATDHCGIVEQLAGGGIMAIEGNTGSGNDADGGQKVRGPGLGKHPLDKHHAPGLAVQTEPLAVFGAVGPCGGFRGAQLRPGNC